MQQKTLLEKPKVAACWQSHILGCVSQSWSTLLVKQEQASTAQVSHRWVGAQRAWGTHAGRGWGQTVFALRGSRRQRPVGRIPESQA